MIISSRRGLWVLFSNRFRTSQSRSFCSNNKIENPNITAVNDNNNNGSKVVNANESSSSSSRVDASKDIYNLDFMTAAKILFSDTPKKKKFGIDFHLVQLFFACLPSLAVYLVAQYARYEMRRMEAELEVKKKAEDEAKAKEMELLALEEEKKKASDPHLLEVKVRLEKLEETVKEIVDESKKKSNAPRGNIQVEETDKDKFAKNESSGTTTKGNSNAEDNSQK